MDTIVKMNNYNAHRLVDFYASKLQDLHLLMVAETKDTGYDFSKIIKKIEDLHLELHMSSISLEDAYNDNV